jgi:hypothetical protein
MGPPPKPKPAKLHTYRSSKYSQAIPAHHHEFHRVEFPQETLLGKYKGPKMYMYYKPCCCTYVYKAVHWDPKCDLRHNPEVMISSIAVEGGVEELVERTEKGINEMEMKITYETCECEWAWVKVGYWDKKEEKLWESNDELKEYQKKRAKEELAKWNNDQGADKEKVEEPDHESDEADSTDENENTEESQEAAAARNKLATQQNTKSPELPTRPGTLKQPSPLSKMSPGGGVATTTAAIRPGSFNEPPKSRMSLGGGVPLATAATRSSAFKEQQGSRMSMGAATGPSSSGISLAQTNVMNSRWPTNATTSNRQSIPTAPTSATNRNRQSIPTAVTNTASHRQSIPTAPTSATNRNRQSIPTAPTSATNRNRQSIPTALSNATNRSPNRQSIPTSPGRAANTPSATMSNRSPNRMSKPAALTNATNASNASNLPRSPRSSLRASVPGESKDSKDIKNAKDTKDSKDFTEQSQRRKSLVPVQAPKEFLKKGLGKS